MERLHEIGRVEPPTAERLASVRTQLLGEARGHAIASRRRRPARRRMTASVVALALVGGGSVAWAAAQRDSVASTNTTIECGLDTFIPAESGNPVLDCYNALARQEARVPPLKGWVTPTGLVAVLPAGEQPPRGSTPLPAKFQVDAGIRYVTDSLSDTTGPLLRGCLTSAAAVAFANNQLGVAGLSGWSVTLGSTSGVTSTCASYLAVVDASTSTVQLIENAAASAPPGGGGDVAIRLENLLKSQMDGRHRGRCFNPADAVATAERDARSLGIASSAVTVSDAGTVGASGPRCPTPFLVPAGYYDVVIWMAPAQAASEASQ